MLDYQRITAGIEEDVVAAAREPSCLNHQRPVGQRLACIDEDRVGVVPGRERLQAEPGKSEEREPA